MKNKYKIKGNNVIIYCNSIKNETIYAIVSLNTFNKKLKSFDSTWFAKWDNDVQEYYIQCTKYMGTECNGATIFLHRFLTDAKEGEYVDHINHKTEDNRDENLRKTSGSENSRNRNGKNSNNKSGYRNVSWNKTLQKWTVQLMVDGKNGILGRFDNVDQAGQFAEKMREKYYGEFAGKS